MRENSGGVVVEHSRMTSSGSLMCQNAPRCAASNMGRTAAMQRRAVKYYRQLAVCIGLDCLTQHTCCTADLTDGKEVNVARSAVMQHLVHVWPEQQLPYHGQREHSRFSTWAAVWQQPVMCQVIQLPLVLACIPVEAAIVDAWLCEPGKGFRLVRPRLVVQLQGG